MGYRSEVYLGVDKEIIEKLLTYAGLNPNAYKMLFEYTEYAKKAENGGLLFYWDHVKWYDSYPDVRIIQEFIMDDEHHEQVKFLRLGESYDDIEEVGGSDNFYFEVDRQVVEHIE